MSTTTQRPTPETDALSNARIGMWAFNLPIDFARKLERERDEARAEAGRLLVVESQQKDHIEAMHEAIREAHEALADLAERWEETPEWHNMAEHNSAWCGKIFTNVRQCKKSHDALSKLQTFLNP